jgi:hypothetical protein
MDDYFQKELFQYTMTIKNILLEINLLIGHGEKVPEIWDTNA